MISINDDLVNTLGSLPNIDILRNKDWDYYKYNDYGVPRVSNILDTCINKSFLIKWAASLGSSEKYNEAKFTALDTGSLAHEMIEDYLCDGQTKDSYKMGKYANQIEAMNSYWNYRSFENDLFHKGFSIESLMLELQCVGPLYGGTIDFVANIVNNATLDSKMYILDFKTSNKISKEYLLQTMLYVLNINYLKSIGDPFFSNFDIKGIGIIRVDKKRRGSYQYLLVDFDTDKDYANTIANTAIDMVKWYYQIQSYGIEYKNIYKNLINREVLF